MANRLTRDEMLMGMALVAAQRGTCSRWQVGCVLSREGRVLVTGYNGAPSKVAHCDHTNNDGPCTVAVHAEANAISFAAKHGVRLDGAELHCLLSPCLSCAQLIINAGITRVVYTSAYRDLSGVRLLVKAGVTIG